MPVSYSITLTSGDDAKADTDGSLRLHLAGEIDTRAVPELRRILAEVMGQSPGTLAVDFRDVSFVGVAAMGVLLDARSAAQLRGTRVFFPGAKGLLQQLMAEQDNRAWMRLAAGQSQKAAVPSSVANQALRPWVPAADDSVAPDAVGRTLFPVRGPRTPSPS